MVKARVAIVDDHALFRHGLNTLLSQDPSFEVVGEAADAREADALAARTRIDVAIVDIALPGLGGASVTRELLRRQPGCKVLALSASELPEQVAEALRAGASGYALKSQPIGEILDAIRAVRGSIRYLAPRLPHGQIDACVSGEAGPLVPLSRREREVFDLLVQGYSNDAAAAQLCIAVRTVETHRHHIMHKLGVRSIVDLMRFAARHDLLRD